MSDRAVSDTGPPLHLTEIGRERLLGLFTEVTLSEQVQGELTWHGVFNAIAAALGGVQAASG